MSDALNEALADAKKHGCNDENITAKIIKHLGIAATSKDAKLVSCSDKSELDRVRESFLKKKLGLTDSDAELDAAIQSVCEKMKNDKNKLRATFYHLLVLHYGKESMFA
jgi:hypothetical protein